MVEIVASISTQMLHDLVREEKVSYRVIEVTDQVMELVLVLSKIEYLLKNAHKSERVLNHIETMRYLSYRIEDVLETCAVKVAFVFQRSEERCIRRLLRRYFGALNDGIAVKNIRSMISGIEPEIKSFNQLFTDNVMESIRKGKEPIEVAVRSVRWPRQMYPRGIEEHFVGMDKELKKLISLVVEEQQHRVISIWGVKGLGKTTISRKVYNDSEVRRCFKAFAWVSLSQDCQIGILLQDILRQLGPGKGKVKEITEEQIMIDQLKEIQKQKSCLIVLDGVWEVDQWKHISSAFQMEEGMCTRILLTTREENVAGVGLPFKLRLLDEDEGWELLKKHAFPRKKAPDFGMLPKLGKEMVWKCGYLPLSISILGRNLSSKIPLSEWQMVNNDVTRYLQGDHQSEANERLFDILDSSYDHLSYHLKQCFLYLGIFREAEDINSEDLIFLWMAEGMVSSAGEEKEGKTADTDSSAGEEKEETTMDTISSAGEVREGTTMDTVSSAGEVEEGTTKDTVSSAGEVEEGTTKDTVSSAGEVKEETTMDTVSSAGEVEEGTTMDTVSSAGEEKEETTMDTAEYYLQQLACSGMLQVQVDELSGSRRFKSFCLHNRARELSLYQGEKEDFRLKVVDFCDGKQPTLDSFTLSDGTRRLVIHFNKQVNLLAQDLVATDHLRSLFFLNSDQKYVYIPVRISDFVKFKLLRVLHFVRCKFEGRKLPKGIDKLVNLRYFGLLYCDLDELPPSISNLRNLHVLNVRAYDNAQITIPNVLSQMIRLKHLRLPDYSYREQTNKLILGDLLELETLVGFNILIHDLSSLSKLKKLRHLVTHAYSNDSLTSIIRFVMIYGARMRTNLFIENKCNFTSPEGFAILEEVLMCPNLHALTLSMVLIYKFPDCGMHMSSDLTQLKLIGCKLKEDPMEALGKFLNLQKLCLGYGAFVGIEMAIHDRGFLNLEYLEFRSLPNLEEWRVDVGAMHNLSTLTVRRCPKLEKIPDGLTSISSLKNMEIELAPSALVEGRKEEYLRKFGFVNSFIIRELDPFSASKNNAQ